MRRGATLVIAFGLTVSGMGSYSAITAARQVRHVAARSLSAVTAQAVFTGRSSTHPVRAAARPAPGMKVVRFAGYQIEVPATWPVYRLDRDPTRCVRYDRHAVYLGRPGAYQQCPAHLAGRVATVSMQASAPGGALAAAPFWRGVPSRMGLQRGLARSGGTVLEDSQDQELRAVVRGPALTLTATYGGSTATAARVIASLRRVPSAATRSPATRTARARQWAASTAATGGPVARSARVRDRATLAAGVRRPAARTAPARSPARRTTRTGNVRTGQASRERGRRHRPQPVPVGMAGFDTCTAPALKVMKAWRPDYSTLAIYLGGPEAACGYGNLSPAWVRAVTRMGWSLLPAYVGPQAPCTKFRARIRVGHARMEGKAAASNAIRLARALGIGRGAPIYDDMEWFNPRKGSCRRQVLSFLNGWTRRLHARGYRSGVYSSADSAVRDLGLNSKIYGQRLVKPNSIWFAIWNGKPTLQGRPFIAGNWWDGRQRIKQYQGGHRVRIGGFTLDIDSDLVHGPVYR